MDRIGIIADTHGLLRPEVLPVLQDCGHIIHAGDVGRPEVLEMLRTLGPVSAIRGNVDRGSWADLLPEEITLSFGVVKVHVLHERAAFVREVVSPDCRVVVSGHSHQPLLEEKEGILWINPGSAGPRRFRLPVTVALLEVGDDGQPQARLIVLEIAPGSPPVAKRPGARAGASSSGRPA